jgi:GR25 family glycosyltransferase involved in LPS biosynthesis
MNILIISRRSEKSRRGLQSQQMERLGLEFEFLDAFEASDLSDDHCQNAANHWPSPTPRHDIACFVSHRSAWQKIVERNERSLILEDDAVLSNDISHVLETIEQRNDDWNCAYDLEFAPRPHILSKSCFWTDQKSGYRAKRIFQNRLGLAGYIIGPAAAKKMLEDTKTFSLVESYFWDRPWLTAYQVEPAPVVQLRFISDEVQPPAFLRPKIDTIFRPQNRLLKYSRRLALESTKARNLLNGLIRGEKRNIEFDRTRFLLGQEVSSAGKLPGPESRPQDKSREISDQATVLMTE